MQFLTIAFNNFANFQLTVVIGGEFIEYVDHLNRVSSGRKSMGTRISSAVQQRVRSLVGSTEESGEPAAVNPTADRVAAGRQTKNLVIFWNR